MPNKSTPSRKLSQPRNKRKTVPLVPFDPDPPPPHILESMVGYEFEGPNDPFGAEIEDRDHLLPMKQIAQLAQGDFPDWSALNMILLAVIRSNPSANVREEERLEKAREALLGHTKRGRREVDDHAMLHAMANHYAKLRFLDGIKEPETDVLITAVLDSNLWPDRGVGGADFEKWKAVRKRLRMKFEANKSLYLAAETASKHPEQKKRWAVAKEIISLLEELNLVATTEKA